jgi:hypothetical protein
MGRENRRMERSALVAGFGEHAESALDLLELFDLAWHDCYGDRSPPERVVIDAITVAQGDISKLARSAFLGVIDFRDLRLAADAMR